MLERMDIFEQKFTTSRQAAIDYFEHRNSKTKSIETRFYYFGKKFGYTYNEKSGVLSISAGTDTYVYTLSAKEKLATGFTTLKVIDNQLYLIVVSHPKPEYGGEMDFCTRLLTITENGLVDVESAKGVFSEILQVGNEKTISGYLIYDDKAPRKLKTEAGVVTLDPSLYYVKSFITEFETIYLLSRGYEYALYRVLADGAFEAINTTGTFAETIVKIGESIYGLYQNKGKARYGSIVRLDNPDCNFEQNMLVQGGNEKRLYNIIGSLGQYILIETYNSKNSIYLTIWKRAENGSFIELDPREIEGYDEGVEGIFTPTQNGESVKPLRILGSNDQTTSLWVGNDKSSYSMYNITSKSGALEIKKPDDIVQPEACIVPLHFQQMELNGAHIGIAIDTNTRRSEDSLYDSDVHYVTSYGGRYSLIVPPIHPGTLGHLTWKTRGLVYNEILSHGAQTDYERGNRVDPRDVKDSDYQFGPSEEMADYLIQKIIKDGEKKVLAEGGSFAGVTILITIVALIDRFINGKISDDEILKIFKCTLFATRSAVMDPSNTRVHNQPYYLSEKYVAETFKDRGDLKQIAAYRTPVKSVPAAFERLRRYLNNGKKFQLIISAVKVSLYTFAEDMRCPVEPHRRFVQILRSHGLNPQYSEMPGCNHGYYMQGEYLELTVAHFDGQNKMFETDI